MGCGASTVAVAQQPTESSTVNTPPGSGVNDKLISKPSSDKTAIPGSGPSNNGSENIEGESSSEEGSDEESDEDDDEDGLQPHASQSQPSDLRQKSSVKEMFMAGVAGLKSFSSQMMKSFRAKPLVEEPAKQKPHWQQEPSAKERRAQAAAKLEAKRQREEQEQWERAQAEQGMYGLQHDPYSPTGGGYNQPRARCQSALPYRSTPTLPSHGGLGVLPPVPGVRYSNTGAMGGLGAVQPGRGPSGNGAMPVRQSQNGILPPIHNSNRGTPMGNAGFLQPLGAMPGAGFNDPYVRPSARPSSAMPIGGAYKGLTQYDSKMDYLSLLQLTNKPAGTTNTTTSSSSPGYDMGAAQAGIAGTGLGATHGLPGPGTAAAAPPANDPWAMLAQLKA